MCFRTSHIYLSNIFIFQGRTPLGLCLGTWKVVIKKREGKEESRARRLCSKSVLNLVLNQGVVVIVIVGSYYSSSSCWVPLIVSPSSSSLPSPPRLPPSSYRFPLPLLVFPPPLPPCRVFPSFLLVVSSLPPPRCCIGPRFVVGLSLRRGPA